MAMKTRLPDDSLYETDFYAWTLDQGEQLRRASAGHADVELDWDNLIDEILSFGQHRKSVIRERLQQLLFHLATLAWSPQTESRRYRRLAIISRRAAIAHEFSESPSLRGYPQGIFSECWDFARRSAEVVLDLPEDTLPADCPWELDRQVLDEDWLPPPPDQTV